MASRLALTSLLVVALGAAARRVLTLTPTAHDFGKVAIGSGSTSKDFSITGLVAQTDTLLILFNGRDPTSFVVDRVANVCGPSQVGVPCKDIQISFFPRTVGPKSAIVEITDKRGNRATARLTGEGVVPLCTNTVVFCNYAHLYTGTFSWTVSLRGQHGSNITSLEVTVKNGEAWCTGSELRDGPAGPWRGSITGPGLIGVEFREDPLYSVGYEITVACPSPTFPNHPDGSTGQRSEPAELGSSYSITTNKQAAQVVGQDLTGGVTYPAPESDPLNGVTGSVGLTWSLLRNPPPPPPPPPPR